MPLQPLLPLLPLLPILAALSQCVSQTCRMKVSCLLLLLVVVSLGGALGDLTQKDKEEIQEALAKVMAGLMTNFTKNHVNYKKEYHAVKG